MDKKQTFNGILHSRVFYLVIAAFVALAVLPLLITDNFFLYVLTLICIMAIYAASWNFLANSGQGSLGHAAFLGIGGFSAALLGTSISTSLANLAGTSSLPIGAASVTILVVVLLVGGLISAGIGLLIGLACVRLKAWYLAMVTFGFSVIISTLSGQFDSFTNGINGFAPATLVPTKFPTYILVLTFTVASISVMYLIMKSRMGLAFRAIHGNEAEAKMIGINTAKYKLVAFVISTFFAGVAGGLDVFFLRFVQNEIFSPANSFLPLIMTVIGGLGTTVGPIIGSIFWVTIQQTTTGPYFTLSLVVIGIVLLLIVIFSPKGLAPLFQKIYNRIVAKPQSKEAKKP